jgi:AcrR family transcriptional regulator
MPRRRKRDGNATRDRLVDAALELFAAQGWDATTTTALAQRAGVAEGTIYRHFSSKHQLLNEVYRTAQRWGLTRLQMVDPEHLLPSPQRFLSFGQRLIEAAATTPALVRLLFASEFEPRLDENSRKVRRDFWDALVRWVAIGKSDGLVRAGPAELWAAIWFELVGFGVNKVIRGEWTADHSQLPLVMEAAWQAIAVSSPGNTSLRGAGSAPAPIESPGPDRPREA